MSVRFIRLAALTAILLLAIPSLAQRPNPTPAAPKETTTTGPTGTGPTTSADGLIRQWASLAVASSEYGTSDWSAMQATGAPDSRGCADQPTAFATRTAGNGEYLIVSFDELVIPTQINVHIVLNPGTISSLAVGNSRSGEDIINITNSDNFRQTSCPGVHSVDILDADRAVDSVIINLDQAASGSWTEIDAVELVGYAVGSTPPTNSTGPTGPTGPTAQATPEAAPGISVNCGGNVTFDNGVEVIVNMRPGFTYTATVIGVGSFDPIIAVIDEQGNTLCNDDDTTGARYVANLPTTGPVGPSVFTARKPFSYSGSSFGDVSLVVGSVGSQAGEFLLVVEGLGVTRADGSGEGAGDPFVINVTPNMVLSGVDYTAYMLAVTDVLDTMITAVDEDNVIIRLNDGTPLSCDDAGNAALCFDTGFDLSDSYVSRSNNTRLPGGPYDSMLRIPFDAFTLDGGYIDLRFTSSSQSTVGDYVAIFHLGTSAAR